MDKCREEFEKKRYWIGLFRTGVDFDVTLGEFGGYISNGTKRTDEMDLESFNEKWEAWANCWQYQQAKVDEQAQEITNLKSLIQGHELRHQQNLSIKQKLTRRSEELQKQNAWLSDIAERENKRANKLQEENVFTTVLLGKVEKQKAELQKRMDKLSYEFNDFKLRAHHISVQKLDADAFYDYEKKRADELQKRVDSLEKAEFKLAQVKAILQNNPKLLESILIKKIEQALKGEG